MVPWLLSLMRRLLLLLLLLVWLLLLLLKATRTSADGWDGRNVTHRRSYRGHGGRSDGSDGPMAARMMTHGTESRHRIHSVERRTKRPN
jgi:hypothetical protein